MTQPRKHLAERVVYKIATAAQWQAGCEAGELPWSSDDRRDGFMHLSTRAQLAVTAAKHFKGQTGLMLLAIATAALGEDLRYEPSRGGDLFPHLYGPLAMAHVVWSVPLASTADGIPVMPAEIGPS